jgi:drug/metabolite transporter (DMT)-like permease
MSPILLALLACAGFGVSDYLQGMAARKTSSIPVMVVAQNTGLLAIVIATPALGGSPSPNDLIYGGFLGILLLAGIALLIFSFRHGPITIASTIIGVIGVALPAAYGILEGEHPGGMTYTGLVMALAAILLIELGKGAGTGITPVAFMAAVGSGLAFGGFAIVMSKVGSDAGLWPLLVAYLVRSLLLGIAILFLRPQRLMESCRTVFMEAGLAGVMVTLASAAFLLSLQNGGPLVLVNTISQEAPIVTVTLAVVLLKERLSAVQRIGLCAGLVSLALMGL